MTHIHTLEDGRAIMSASMNEIAFGPIFKSTDEAWAFERWVKYAECLEAERAHDLMLRASEVFGPHLQLAVTDAYRVFCRLPLVECRRCGEQHADTDGVGLCPGACRCCEFCSNSDNSVHNRGDHGWLCASCCAGVHV